jgi:hypothetical protein
MTGPDFGYDVAGLESAATGQDGAAASATGLAQGLSRIVVSAADLGRVPAVTRFVAAAQAARDAQTTGARAESQRRADLAGRARTNAHMASMLTTDTTSIAGGATPGAVDRGQTVPFGDGTAILGD